MSWLYLLDLPAAYHLFWCPQNPGKGQLREIHQCLPAWHLPHLGIQYMPIWVNSMLACTYSYVNLELSALVRSLKSSNVELGLAEYCCQPVGGLDMAIEGGGKWLGQVEREVPQSDLFSPPRNQNLLTSQPLTIFNYRHFDGFHGQLYSGQMTVSWLIIAISQDHSGLSRWLKVLSFLRKLGPLLSVVCVRNPVEIVYFNQSISMIGVP